MPLMQTRGVKTLDFAGTKEEVYERGDWPREKILVARVIVAVDVRIILRTIP